MRKKILKGAQPKNNAGPKPDPRLISYAGGKRYTPKPDTIPINSTSIKKYLDKSIRFWRNELKNSKTRENKLMAKHYIDAYQSVRVSLLGETLAENNKYR